VFYTFGECLISAFSPVFSRGVLFAEHHGSSMRNSGRRVAPLQGVAQGEQQEGTQREPEA
jgi:hypothetical protein